GLVAVLLIGWAVWAMFAVERADNFEYTTTDGRTRELRDHEGDIVVIDFMFSSCTACRKGMPELVKFYEKYHDDIVMISVSPIEGGQERDDLRDLKREFGARWDFAQIDEEIAIEDYGVTEYPTIIILDKEQYVVYKGHGDAGELGDEVDKVKEGRSTRQAILKGSIYTIAFVAGMMTFFSPCAFPLMPAYMSYYVTLDGAQATDRDLNAAVKRGILQGSIPAMAMLMFFSIVGIIVGLAGSAILGYLGIFELMMGLLIVGFGAMMFLGRDIPFHYITTPLKQLAGSAYGLTKRISGGFISVETAEKVASRVTGRDVKLNAEGQGLFPLFTYGIVYAAASSACVAPLFFLIITFALTQGGVLGGFVVLLLYGLGMGLLMIVFTAALAAGRMSFIDVMKRHMAFIKKVSALIMIVAGLILVVFWLQAEAII
ncbi:MAG: redoxin domain-containing protein, partial [Thermoplasmata archaeon]|nr:redoxin domain-containing protein [Thermoplasmata archaeon]